MRSLNLQIIALATVVATSSYYWGFADGTQGNYFSLVNSAVAADQTLQVSPVDPRPQNV